MIVSPYLAVFIVVSVIALLALALFAGVDARNRSLRHRMSQYVSVPTEEEGRMRRAEVTAMLAAGAQRRVEGHRWWQSFERDVELGGFKYSTVGIAGWTIVGAIVTSLVVAIAFQSLWGLLAGLAVPFVTRYIVKSRVKKKRKAFGEQLPDNLDVLAGALRAGHSLVGAMNVMLEGAQEPFKSEFRRVLQDEQLGVPLDDALMVMSRRMENPDVEQVAIVTRLQREAGGNTAEVLDRVVDNIRGRMELQRLVQVLTAQGRIARYILTAIPVFLLRVLPPRQQAVARAALGDHPRQRRHVHVGDHAGRRLVRNQEDRRNRGLDMGIELMAVAGILLLGGGLTILIINLRRPQGVATLDQIGTYGYVAENAGGAEDGAARRPLDSLAGRVGDTAARRLGRFSEAEVRAKLVSAGMYGTTPRKILGYQILAAIFLSMLALWGIPVLGYSIVLAVVGAICGGTIGWFLPMVYIDRTTRQRFEKIDRQMPDMIDLLVVTIEAGLGILASMRVASERLPGSARPGVAADAAGAAGSEWACPSSRPSRASVSGQTRRTCACSSARSPRARSSASRSPAPCETSRPRCASGGGRWRRRRRRRCRSSFSSRSSSSSSRRS